MSLRRSAQPAPETGKPGLDPARVAAVQKMLREARNGKPGKGNIVRRIVSHPVRAVPVAFLLVIIIGAALLMLPATRTDGGAEGFMPALFTSVSAVCVTGLITVDTATFWTPFGQGVILGLIQVGGFGIMTLATLLALLVRKNIGLRGQLVAQTETHTLNLGDVRAVLVRVAKIMLTFEAATALFLTARFWIAYDQNPATALWHGIFHAISAFNNAGFSVYSDNLIGFAEDPWIITPICLAIIAGGLGFPVIIQLTRGELKPKYWTIHLRLTIYGTLFLLAAGTTLFAAFEWNRNETLGQLSLTGKLLGSFAGGVFPRTAGFNSIDYGVAAPETLMVTNILMFIGGGSAGTAGGIKVTTFALLAFVILAEIRGEPTVHVLNRRLPGQVQRQALTVALLGVGVVMIGTFTLLALTPFRLDDVLFETISAFATVGLSTGITAKIPDAGQFVLMALMFIGRLGPITMASALALRERPRRYELAEERPVVG